MLSGVIAVIGTRMYEKRRREKDNEKQVEIEDGRGLESEKEIKQSEDV